MPSLHQMFAEARARLAEGKLTEGDLDRLLEQALRPGRQRLLYLYALQPTVRSVLVATTLHEPGAVPQIDPLQPELPYQCVMDAIEDGWRVVHFPDHRGPFQEGRMDLLGYEFVLEKTDHV